MPRTKPTLRIDHVTIAGPDLTALETSLAGTGLRFAYGGPHSNGVTHMSLVSFEDGSYLELISTLDPRLEAPLWPVHIANGGGPCAWAVRVDDVASESERLTSLGIDVRGPVPMHRRLPDGRVAEWDLAFVGEGNPGATFPFLIGDRTPRGIRVPRPEAHLETATISGIETVVLAVANLDRTVDLFRRAYGLDAARLGESDLLDARVAAFDDAPVAIAAAERGWLAERLERFGPSPCAFLIGSTAIAESAHALDLPPPEPWMGKSTTWFDPTRVDGMRLGLVERFD